MLDPTSTPNFALLFHQLPLFHLQFSRRAIAFPTYKAPLSHQLGLPNWRATGHFRKTCLLSLLSRLTKHPSMPTSSRRSSGPVLPVTSAFQRAGALGNSSMLTSDSSPFTSSSFASSTTYYSSSPAGFFNQSRSASPTRVNLHGLSQPPPTRSVRFAIDRSISPGRSISAAPRSQVVQRSRGNIQKRTCLCSPSTHPGSFRCALHRNNFGGGGGNHSISYSPNRLNMRRSAMTNSLVRIGTVEGDLVKRALAALIRPSSHQQRRRAAFQPRPSRLSVMAKADDM